MTPLLESFLRYVQVDTTADASARCYPSSPGQLVLGAMLRDELLALGYSDARQTEHGIIYATIPSTLPAGENAPVVALVAHMDTSPETTGKNVRPIVHAPYHGGDLVLPGNPSQVLRVAEQPALAALAGKTIVTTDGTTLLGGDDKAGVAVIMEVARQLAHGAGAPHGPIRVVFTCDEEIGQGVKYVDLQELQADVAYTLDGAGVGDVEGETFSADLATIHVQGVNCHPGYAFGTMVNAIKVASTILARLPRDSWSPETTRGREGFVHPYTIQGGVQECTVQVLLRDFETERLAEYLDRLQTLGRAAQDEFPGSRVTITTTTQYRNMREGLAHEPRAMALAVEALRQRGRTAQTALIRGGTDGSRLTEMGLPTPNLSTGEHCIHSPLEWVCLEELEENVAVVLALLQLWAKERRAESL
jgi:tripeptide aminopeptidase